MGGLAAGLSVFLLTVVTLTILTSQIQSSPHHRRLGIIRVGMAECDFTVQVALKAGGKPEFRQNYRKGLLQLTDSGLTFIPSEYAHRMYLDRDDVPQFKAKHRIPFSPEHKDFEDKPRVKSRDKACEFDIILRDHWGSLGRLCSIRFPDDEATAESWKDAIQEQISNPRECNAGDPQKVKQSQSTSKKPVPDAQLIGDAQSVTEIYEDS